MMLLVLDQREARLGRLIISERRKQGPGTNAHALIAPGSLYLLFHFMMVNSATFFRFS